MPRPYRPPTAVRRRAYRVGRRLRRRVRIGLVPLLGAVLALTSLSVAGARLWSDAPGGPLPMATAAPRDAVAQAQAAAPDAPSAAGAASTSEGASLGDGDDSRLAALLDPSGGANVTLELTFGDAHQTLRQPELAALVVASDGGLPHLNDAAVQALVAHLADTWNQSVRNARFAWHGGSLTPIRESQQGRTLDRAGAASAIGQALLGGESRVSLPGTIVQPQVSSDNPQALGITDNLDRGSTSFAGSTPEKVHNIQLAAERLNGVVVPPGGTFSFNDEVGPTTLDAGFEWGFGIEAGANGARTVPSVAGGICQVATTLFQRVFWAGFPLVERHWHLYWIPAYASRGIVGLDATVDEDSGLDFRWSNPTDGYVLIQSATDEGNVYFGLYGKQRGWKVSVGEPQITNRVPPNTDPVAEAEPSLPWGRIQPVESAREGFDIAITRTVTREDGEPRALTVKSSYEPSRTVTLVGTKGKPADADVDAVLARIAPPHPAQAAPSAVPSPVVTNAPVAGPSATPGEVPAVATPAASPSSSGAAAARPTDVARLTPAPDPSPTPRPAATNTPAPATPTPSPARPTATPAARPPATATPANSGPRATPASH